MVALLPVMFMMGLAIVFISVVLTILLTWAIRKSLGITKRYDNIPLIPFIMFFVICFGLSQMAKKFSILEEFHGTDSIPNKKI